MNTTTDNITISAHRMNRFVPGWQNSITINFALS
jgi:hypothetical protein